MASLSVIIVSWNAKNYLRDCLTSVYQAAESCEHEIIVVDNASSDGSPEMVMAEFPEVILIRANDNLGFARANNLAMNRASGSMFALVNSDVIVHPGCLETLTTFLEQHKEVGMVGPQITGADGALQRTCRRFPRLWNTACRILALDMLFPDYSIFSGFELPPAAHHRCIDVEVLSGCFCVIRKEAVVDVGGLDEQFFFYAEDIDWCKRMGDAGWKLMFVPEAVATHFGGGSTSNAPLRYSIQMLRSTLKYWGKHHGRIGRMICYILLLAHHGVRLPVRLMKICMGFGENAERKHKFREDITCLRWLLTGRDI